MKLTTEEQGWLDGEEGPVIQKIVKSVVRYGDIFGADRLIPITGDPHFVISIGVGLFKPYLDMIDKIISAGLKTEPYTADPRPIDHKNVKSSLLQKILFRMLYNKQDTYEKMMHQTGLKNDNAFSCACYLDEVGNIPQPGDILAWSESSAVSYANSVIGARTNRNSAGIDILCNVIKRAPLFDLLTDDGRKATWAIDVQTEELPDPQLLGSAIGLKVMEDVPYITGLDRFLGTDLNGFAKDYLKDLGAAAASNGAVGLYHVDSVTPEAKVKGRDLINENASTYTITQEVLDQRYHSYPNIWPKKTDRPEKVFIGCPHLSLQQLNQWTDRIHKAVTDTRHKVYPETILFSAPDVIDAFKKDRTAYDRLMATGSKLTAICPLMYMSNPLSQKRPIVTNSNKLRVYSTARFFQDNEILSIISTGKIGHQKEARS